MKLHIIDGTYELFRAHFGAPPAKAPDGREIGATRGLMRSLASLLGSGVTHVAVAFDTVIESFRNELFDGYKTGAGMDPCLFSQFPLAEEATRNLGIVTWSMVEFEADDALATAAARFQDQAEQIVICSPDKDLAQCVTQNRVITWDRKNDREYDEAGVVEKFGVAPSSIPDYLALVGDAADGIPGIPRWGAKGTAAILGEYGHIHRIPADPADWSVTVRGAARLSAELEAARENAQLYRTLATLRTDVPLNENLSELRWEGALPELNEFCAQLGERTLLGRVTRWKR